MSHLPHPLSTDDTTTLSSGLFIPSASSQLSEQAKVAEETALAMQFIASKGKLDAQDQANMQGFVLEAIRE